MFFNFITSNLAQKFSRRTDIGATNPMTIIRLEAKTPYRPDIDGLRAIAVLSVVIFHAFPDLLIGGFIGVDVFFVISGFLITGIINQKVQNNSFSISEFYCRRIKRIFPALLLVLLSTFVLGWLFSLPIEFSQIGKDIAGGAAFISNFLFWNEAGYFDQQPGMKPLLHLWSLSIEEQFYIFWPIFLVLLSREKYRLSLALIIMVGSLAINISYAHINEVATFYSPLTRAWELLAGSLLSLIMNRINKRDISSSTPLNLLFYKKRATAEISVILGIVLLAFGFLKIQPHTTYPGVWAIIPVLGTVLILCSADASTINRMVFSNRFLVFIGLISYPLYLWHWPLIVFVRIVEMKQPETMTLIGVIFISLTLAWLTYEFLERPIRSGRSLLGTAGILSLFMVLIGALGYFTYYHSGFAERYPKNIQAIFQSNAESRLSFLKAYRRETCFLKPTQGYENFSKCKIEDQNDKLPYVLLWGDSHAAHLYPGYKAAYQDIYNIVQRTASACPPILNLDVPWFSFCKGINDQIFNSIKQAPPSRIILSAHWVIRHLPGLQKTIAELQKLGIPIDVIGPTPKWNGGLPKQLYSYYARYQPDHIPERTYFGLNYNFMLADRAFKHAFSGTDVRYISTRDILCNSEGCLTRLGETIDTLTTIDVGGHLSETTSIYLVSKFPK